MSAYLFLGQLHGTGIYCLFNTHAIIYNREVEPFQDVIPPRHQVESDESDEDVYPSTNVKRTVFRSHINVVVQFEGPQEKKAVSLGSIG